MDLIKRFLGYTAVDTQSDENSQTVPSTAKQMNLARLLKTELEGMGLEEVFMDDMGYVYASLPANTDKKIPTIGFISHMDTSPSMSGKDVKPRIVNNYDGGDIILNKEQNIILSPSLFPELLAHKGEDLIVTDGTTLLGADDKAGIAIIMSALEYFSKHQDVANKYAEIIADELHRTLCDTNLSQYEQILLNSAKSECAKEYLPVFFKEVKRVLSKYAKIPAFDCFNE